MSSIVLPKRKVAQMEGSTESYPFRKPKLGGAMNPPMATGDANEDEFNQLQFKQNPGGMYFNGSLGRQKTRKEFYAKKGLKAPLFVRNGYSNNYKPDGSSYKVPAVIPPHLRGYGVKRKSKTGTGSEDLVEKLKKRFPGFGTSSGPKIDYSKPDYRIDDSGKQYDRNMPGAGRWLGADGKLHNGGTSFQRATPEQLAAYKKAKMGSGVYWKNGIQWD